MKQRIIKLTFNRWQLKLLKEATFALRLKLHELKTGEEWQKDLEVLQLKIEKKLDK